MSWLQTGPKEFGPTPLLRDPTVLECGESAPPRLQQRRTSASQYPTIGARLYRLNLRLR